jgi:L-iditol 2-dehydrogenase
VKALRLHAIHDLRLHEEQMPVPKEDEALLKVASVGICGSDLHMFSEGTTSDRAVIQPFTLGHEFSAVVEGGELDGVRVAVDPQVPCGACEFCLEGNTNLCPDHYFAGQAPQDGALREYLVWPKANLFPIPDEISTEDGAMLEPLGVAIHTIALGKLKAGMQVGVFGCGPIGLLTVQLAKLAGVEKIIATDKFEHRLEMAQKFGAEEVFLSRGGEENNLILDATKGRGLDITFEVAGENDAVETAVETCKPGGRVVLCGIPSVNRTSFKASTARRKGLTIKLVRRMKHTYPRAIELVKNGQIDVRLLVTHRFSLDQYQEAFQVANERQGLKVIINL